jgi:hypothetical protein
VPPEADAVKLTGVPTVPVGAVVNDIANVIGEMTIVAEAPTMVLAASVTFTLMVNVPFTL